MNIEEALKIGVICRPRTSGQTYNNFIRIYNQAKRNGYKDVNVIFIDPELDKLQKRIDKAIEYIKKESYDGYFDMYGEQIEKLLEILKGEDK